MWELIRKILEALGLLAPPVVIPPTPTGPTGPSSGPTSSTGATSPTSPSPSGSTGPSTTPVNPYPSGNITAISPGATATTSRWKSIPWSQVSRWEPFISQAQAKYKLPRGLLEGVLLIETNANHYTTGQRTGVNGSGSYRRPLASGEVVVDTDQVPAIGIAQVKAAFHAKPDENAWTPEGNISLAARLLDMWIASEGSWQGAIRKYHPGTDPDSGTNQDSYIKSVQSVMDELTKPTPPTGPSGVTGPAGGITFGRVPLPTFTDRRIPDANNKAWNNLGKRTVRGVMIHRQQGGNWGTDGYFRKVPPGGVGACPAPNTQFVYGGCNGLTDWGVDDTTGETLMWNSPGGYGIAGSVSPDRSPWASGPWNRPAGSDLICLVDKYGVNVINRDLPSIEVSGYAKDAQHPVDQPVSTQAVLQIANIVAYHADTARVGWDDFPFNPHTGCMFIYWHNESCGLDYKTCPGEVVMGLYDEIVTAAKGILRDYQTGAK